MARLKIIASLLLVVGAAASRPFASDATPQADPLLRFTYTQVHMGIDARLTVYARSKEAAEEACSKAFERIAELDSIMSDYRRDSELNRLADAAGGPPVTVSPDLFKVLQRAEETARRSNGAFDITASPVIRLWRQARKTGELPNPTELEAARSLVGWQKIKLDGRRRTAKLETPGMRLDLGGIAKGYAGDEAQKVLKKHGITRAMVEMGGDIVVSGPPPGAKGWTIRVPNAGEDRGPVDLPFSNTAISTSGDTEQFTIIDGVQYSHVVDPRTGQALTNRIQATIVARDGLTSDPLSTVLTILSEEERARLLRHYPRTKVYIRSLKGS